MHAICHSPDIYKHQCIYCQVSDPTAETEWSLYTSPGCTSDEIQMEEVDASPAEVAQAQNPCIEEVLFSPKDASQIQPLFDCITELQNKNSETSDEEYGAIAFNPLDM